MTPLLDQDATRGKQRAITSLAFITANRCAMLQRALASYVENCRTYGRRICISVMDDSLSASTREDYRQCLHRLDCDYPVRYCGLEEKHAYIEQLARLGIDPEIAGFALLGDRRAGICTTGANRNCELLDAAGELVLSADDDTVCRLAIHPAHDAHLRLGGHHNPRELLAYRTREEFCRSTKWESRDLLAEHERSLGRRLTDLAAEPAGNMIETEDTCDHLRAGLRRDDAAIVATITGIAGDSGSGSAQSFFFSSQQALDQIAGSDAAFQAAFSTREVLWTARSHTITHGPHCQGASLGLANDRLLPPFFPLGRNQDGIFGALSLMTPASFLGHIPVAVLHDPARGRTYDRFPPFRIASLILSLIWLAAPFRYNSIRDALAALGKILLQLTALPEPEFWDALNRAAARNQMRTVRMLERSRKKMGDGSTQAHAEVAGLLAHFSRHSATVDGCIPCEFRERFPLGTAREKTRRLVRDAARLFCAWPDMADAAKHLRSQGVRLSRSVREIVGC